MGVGNPTAAACTCWSVVTGLETQERGTKKGERAEMVRFYLMPSPLILNINFIATGLLVKEEQEQAAFMF